jgi:hypothetical protein
MAKRDKPRDWAGEMEQAMRKAIDQLPGVRDAPEAVYCRAVAEAADLIKAGAEERLLEIEAEGEDEDD